MHNVNGPLGWLSYSLIYDLDLRRFVRLLYNLHLFLLIFLITELWPYYHKFWLSVFIIPPASWALVFRTAFHSAGYQRNLLCVFFVYWRVFPSQELFTCVNVVWSVWTKYLLSPHLYLIAVNSKSFLSMFSISCANGGLFLVRAELSKIGQVVKWSSSFRTGLQAYDCRFQSV